MQAVLKSKTLPFCQAYGQDLRAWSLSWLAKDCMRNARYKRPNWIELSWNDAVMDVAEYTHNSSLLLPFTPNVPCRIFTQFPHN